MAERWELVNDAKTWRFHLRRGVQFHDGRPFGADDVVWTWGVRQLEGKTLGTVANTLGPESVRKVDDFTVDFTPTVANLRIPEQIVHPEGAIVPKGNHNDSTPPAEPARSRSSVTRPSRRLWSSASTAIGERSPR